MKKTLFSQEKSFFFGILAIVWQVVFFYIPISFLVAASVVSFSSEFNSSFFTFSHYQLFFRAIYIKVFLRSFLLALSTVIITLLISYPVAFFLAVRLKKWKTFFFALLVVPFWTNFLLLVYAWYFLLENDGVINRLLLSLGFISEPLHLINSYFAVHMGMVYCYLPFMLLPLYSTFEKLDYKLLEASADLGASHFQTFKNIILPLTWPGIRTGIMLVSVPAFGEFVVPALLGGDKNMYVGSVIAHYFLTVRDVPLGSAFTCLSVIVLFLIFIFFYTLNHIIYTVRKVCDV